VTGGPADSGRVAFLCAMPMEARPLVRRLSLRPTQIGGVPVDAGTLGGRAVIALVTGMGTGRSADATRRLLDAVVLDHVVVVGITGALENVTPVGTLVCPAVVVDGATGVTFRPTPLGGERPRGTMWTADGLLTDAAAVAELRARGVISLDMETASIARECDRRAVAWSVFRAVSDRATDGSVDDEVFHLSSPDGSPDGAAVARYLLRHPARVPGLVRLAKAARLASQTAADAAVCAVERMWESPPVP